MKMAEKNETETPETPTERTLRNIIEDRDQALASLKVDFDLLSASMESLAKLAGIHDPRPAEEIERAVVLAFEKARVNESLERRSELERVHQACNQEHARAEDLAQQLKVMTEDRDEYRNGAESVVADMVHTAWGLIANSKDWLLGNDGEWVKAAIKFRDEIYHPYLGVKGERVPTPIHGVLLANGVDASAPLPEKPVYVQRNNEIVGVDESDLTPYERSRFEFNKYAGLDAGQYPDSRPAELQVDLMRWESREFNGGGNVSDSVHGVNEEAGELSEAFIYLAAMQCGAGRLAHAVLKRKQGIRGFDAPEVYRERAADAVADVMIFAMQCATKLRVDFWSLLESTALEVMDRNWKEDRLEGRATRLSKVGEQE